MTITKTARVFMLAGFIAASGCASSPQTAHLPSSHDAASGAVSPPVPSSPPPSQQQADKDGKDGKYYLDDGPPDDARIAFADIADAVPRREKINPAHNRPYTALGQRFVPDTAPRKYRQRGMASWYGKRYHGRKTSTGEVYDMFQMTAAHPTLAIPGYARVTRADTGESVIVRINDRGPFLGGRIIDLSYAAAGRLGFIKAGTAEVIVESIIPDDAAAAPPIAGGKPVAAKVGASRLYVQFGAFSLAANAERMRDDLSEKTSLAMTIILSDDYYRVVAGPYKDLYTAETLRDDLCAEGWCGLVKTLAQ